MSSSCLPPKHLLNVPIVMVCRKEIRDYFAKFGRQGGKTRAGKMTAERRKEIEQMKAVAVKKGQAQPDVASFWEMGTLRCDVCGEEFLIRHNPAFVDKKNAEKQAHWLEKVLAEEHEREKKHPDRIELPD